MVITSYDLHVKKKKIIHQWNSFFNPDNSGLVKIHVYKRLKRHGSAYILVLCVVSSINCRRSIISFASVAVRCRSGNWTGSGPLQVKRTFVGLRTLEHCCFIRFYNGTLISIRHNARVLNYSYELCLYNIGQMRVRRPRRKSRGERGSFAPGNRWE